MRELDFSSYSISYNAMRSEAGGELLDLYKKDIAVASTRGRLRALEDERQRISSDIESKIIDINFEVWSADHALMLELEHICTSTSHEEHELLEKLKRRFNKVFGGTYNTTYRKPPDTFQDDFTSEYRRLYTMCREYIDKVQKPATLDLETRLTILFRLHYEYRRLMCEKEEATIIIRRLKAGTLNNYVIADNLPDPEDVAREFYNRRQNRIKRYTPEQIAPVMAVTRNFLARYNITDTIIGKVKTIRDECDSAASHNTVDTWIKFYSGEAGLETPENLK